MNNKLNKMLDDIKSDIDELKIPTTSTQSSIRLNDRISTVRNALSKYANWCNELATEIALNPEYLNFTNFENAEIELKDIIWEIANVACEGSHNMGQSQYAVQFTVDGVKYHGTFEVEYDRHDRRYCVDRIHNFQYVKTSQ